MASMLGVMSSSALRPTRESLARATERLSGSVRTYSAPDPEMGFCGNGVRQVFADHPTCPQPND
jgi:hypothetical protein